jgi:hypothetical protein
MPCSGSTSPMPRVWAATSPSACCGGIPDESRGTARHRHGSSRESACRHLRALISLFPLARPAPRLDAWFAPNPSS